MIIVQYSFYNMDNLEIDYKKAAQQPRSGKHSLVKTEIWFLCLNVS